MKRFQYLFLWSLLSFTLFALMHFSDGFVWFYIQDVYPKLRKLTHFIFGYIELSVGDILYTTLLLFFLIRFFRWFITIFRGKFWFSLSRFLTPLFAWVFIFYAFWGLLYGYKDTLYRLGFEKENNIKNKETALRSLSEKMLQESLFWRGKLQPLDSADFIAYHLEYDQLKEEVEQCAAHFAITYLDQEMPVSLKKTSVPSLVSYMKSLGYYNPFTGEAHLNTNILEVQQPFTACHEVAHQLGFAREQEANLVGFLICMESDLPLFRYSACLTALRYTLYNLRKTNDISFYKKLASKIPPFIWKDIKSISNFWKKYDGILDKATTVVFDAYLKSNGQGQGIKSYTFWIELLMRYYQAQPKKITSEPLIPYSSPETL